MSISDQLVTKPRRCAFAMLVQSLPDDDRLAVIDYVARVIEERRTNPKSPNYSVSRLRAVLVNEGHPVSINVMRDHVNNNCICEISS